MGGLWYSLTRVSTEPFLGRAESKKISDRNEKYMRGACRETIIPTITAVGSFYSGGAAGAVAGFATGKELAKVIYPPHKD